MFYFLSKLLTYFLYPFTWGFLLLIWAIFEKNGSRRKKILFGSLIVFYLFSNQFIFDVFVHRWEPTPMHISDIHKTYDFGIVLGGMSDYNKTTKTIRPKRSFDRLLQAIRLYKAKKIKRIFISGGGISLLNDTFPEAYYLVQYLKNCNIPDSVIFYEILSRNTRENAIETEKIFRKYRLNKKNCLLISSAIHLPRAKKCYERLGFKPIDIFPTDSYSKHYRFYDISYWLIPNTETLFNWQSLIKEWIGIVVYRLMGYA